MLMAWKIGGQIDLPEAWVTATPVMVGNRLIELRVAVYATQDAATKGLPPVDGFRIPEARCKQMEAAFLTALAKAGQTPQSVADAWLAKQTTLATQTPAALRVARLAAQAAPTA